MASIKKLDERKFKITVSNGYRPDGRKIAKAKTIEVPKTVQARSVMQYVSHAAEEMEREVKPGYSEDGEMTFEEFALRWLGRQTKYAVSTLNGYRKLLERTYPHIGQIKLNRLRPIAIEKMLIELRKRSFNGRPIKEVSVQKYLVAISAVLSDAKRNEIISKNPARMIDLPPTHKVVQIIPTDNEIKELMTVLLDEPEHYRYYYFLAIYTGCRRGELCALKWSDFKLVNNIPTLVVSRSRSALPYSGVDKQTVAELAGHGDTTFLERTYCHPQTLAKQKAAVGMANMLFGGTAYIDESDWGRYGILRLRYLHEHRQEMYRELLMTGNLSAHCRAIDTTAFNRSERIQADWLEAQPMPLEDTQERIRLRTQAQVIADEIVMAELIYT